jgi:hypothetical protein
MCKCACAHVSACAPVPGVCFPDGAPDPYSGLGDQGLRPVVLCVAFDTEEVGILAGARMCVQVCASHALPVRRALPALEPFLSLLKPAARQGRSTYPQCGARHRHVLHPEEDQANGSAYPIPVACLPLAVSFESSHVHGADRTSYASFHIPPPPLLPSSAPPGCATGSESHCPTQDVCCCGRTRRRPGPQPRVLDTGLTVTVLSCLHVLKL